MFAIQNEFEYFRYQIFLHNLQVNLVSILFTTKVAKDLNLFFNSRYYIWRWIQLLNPLLLNIS